MVLRGILARSEWKEFERGWPVWRHRRPWRCMPPRSGSWGRVPAGSLNPGPSVQGSLAPAHHTSPPWSVPGTGPSQHWLVSDEESGKRNQVEVSWYIGVFTRLSRWEPGFESHHRRGTFVLQQGNLSTLLLSTQVYKWGPGRRWQIIVFEFASAIIGCYTRQGMLPGEWKFCTV